MTIVLPRQKQKILKYLRDYIKKNNYAPTLTEIAKEFHLSSLATAHEHLQYLEEHGFIARDKDKARGISIVEDKSGLAQEKSVMVPLVGLITAGQPIEAIEDRELELPVPQELVKNKNAFILKVSGDSMIESLITDGDFVICEKTEYAKDGDTVVAMLEDGTATLKKFFKTKNLIRLQPANKKYKPLYSKNVVIQGKVLGIIRSFLSIERPYFTIDLALYFIPLILALNNHQKDHGCNHEILQHLFVALANTFQVFGIIIKVPGHLMPKKFTALIEHVASDFLRPKKVISDQLDGVARKIRQRREGANRQSDAFLKQEMIALKQTQKLGNIDYQINYPLIKLVKNLGGKSAPTLAYSLADRLVQPGFCLQIIIYIDLLFHSETSRTITFI